MAEGVTIGVVIIGRNEGERLVRCLASLSDLRIPLVYVDSASTDGSVAAARGAGADVVTLDLARPFTAARARAEGVATLFALHPQIKAIFFVDGDCEVEAGWIETAADFLRSHADFAVVTGRRRERFPQASAYNTLADQEWNTPVGEAQACGGDAVFRRSAYEAVGGFDPAMIAGEEPELCTRLRAAGWRIMRLDAPMTIHDAAMTRFGQWWQRAVRSGFGYAQGWHVTRQRKGTVLYGRELTRALVWAGILPLCAILAAWLIHPLALLIWPLLTLAQFVRLRLRDGAVQALTAVTGKYAELLGLLRYISRIARGQTGGTINYK